MKKKLLLIILLIFVYLFVLQKPNNNRNWEDGQEKIASVEINNNLVSVKNIRDFRYIPEKLVSKNYLEKTYDINSIKKVWFLIEPFGNFKAVAHTYFVFDFEDQEPVVVSVEARKEKGEKFNAIIGAFNQYELIYIWGTESDETIKRVVLENNKLYMYPLNISENGSRQLFLQLAETTRSLETKPRFYNTLTSNCTNELAKTANKVKPGAIPFNAALFLPGYSANELYKLGYIPNDLPIDQLEQRYYISDFVKENYDKADLSERLRVHLNSL